MTITLEQIAELSGVSRSTASRVHNGYPGVRPEVRERVWQAIHEHGYYPNPAARVLALQRMPVVDTEQAIASRDRVPTDSR